MTDFAKDFQILGQVLEADGWHPKPFNGTDIYWIGNSGKQGFVSCYAQVVPELSLFSFQVIAPLKAPPAARAAVVELVARVNFGLALGSFVLDFRDGEVRYKGGLPLNGEGLDPEQVRRVVHTGLEAMDSFIPALKAVVSGGKTPSESLEDINE